MLKSSTPILGRRLRRPKPRRCVHEHPRAPRSQPAPRLVPAARDDARRPRRHRTVPHLPCRAQGIPARPVARLGAGDGVLHDRDDGAGAGVLRARGACAMNERAFTPGPWFVSEPNDPDHTGLLIKPIPGDVVAEIDRIPNAIANARLIAAAPELYE